MDDPNESGVIGGFLKNEREMIAGSITAFRGQTFVHLRTYVPSAAEEGEWIRTEKGVAVLAEQFDKIRSAVHSLWDCTGADVLVARIRRNDHEEIRIGMSEFRSGFYCYVRVYFLNGSAEWTPSKKGISVPTSRLEDLDTLLDAIADKTPTARS